jgi:hypothetical protein
MIWTAYKLRVVEDVGSLKVLASNTEYGEELEEIIIL